MQKSVWSDSAKIPEFKALCGNKKTDVLIIGGGICGILCGWYLKSCGIDCIILEGSRILSGITQNTTAKITAQHGLIYDKLIKSVGHEKAKLYLKANLNAIDKFKELCADIDCDFENKSAYVYSINSRAKIERETEAINVLGFSAEFCESLPLPFRIEGAVKFKNQAQFNPVKFAAAISKDLDIYENSFVRSVNDNRVYTDSGSVTADKIIVATHFPFINTHGSYFLKLYQHRSYVIAYDNAPELYDKLDGMYVDESKTGFSFRRYKELLIVGGGGHRTGKNGGNWQEIRKFVNKYCSNAKEKYFWAAQDCMSLDGIPYIGRYSKNTDNMYAASGFNKWGMTSSMVAAQILCDLVRGKRNEFTEVFSPSRNILKSQLLINGVEAVTNLLMPKTKRCPHLGCALKWNRTERSWDCPCHGSRFTENGELLDNPATGNIK